jgi:hypothetical protein
VLIEEPDRKAGYYGGQTAAPHFKAIAEQVANYLKIRPDKSDMHGKPIEETADVKPGHNAMALR